MRVISSLVVAIQLFTTETASWHDHNLAVLYGSRNTIINASAMVAREQLAELSGLI
jgi:hypothetical protein